MRTFAILLLALCASMAFAVALPNHKHYKAPDTIVWSLFPNDEQQTEKSHVIERRGLRKRLKKIWKETTKQVEHNAVPIALAVISRTG